MMTDRELADASWTELSKTTDSYPTWKRKGFPTTSHWAKAKALLDQIGFSPTPPPSRFPASFFSGPLGKNNVVPTGPGAFLGSMFGGIGVSLGDARKQIDARQKAMGRKYDVIQAHYDGNQGQVFNGAHGCEPPTQDNTGSSVVPPTQENYAHANGSVFMVAWTPDYTIAEINAGAADPIFAEMGAYWGSYDFPIMLRIFHEFDLPTATYGIRSDWGQTLSSYIVTPADFLKAQERAVTKIHGAGGTNVGFVWCPTEGAIGDRSVLANYFDKDLVDWVSSDWYNHNDGYSTPLHPGWSEFDELFHYQSLGSTAADKYTQFAEANGKPFFVGETSSPYDLADVNHKANWFKKIPAAIAAMPNLIGVSFFDVDVSHYNGQPTGDYDWHVDSNAASANIVGTSDPTTLAGFVAMGKDAMFKGLA